jgi:hypothetical protein
VKINLHIKQPKPHACAYGNLINLFSKLDQDQAVLSAIKKRVVAYLPKYKVGSFCLKIWKMKEGKYIPFD